MWFLSMHIIIQIVYDNNIIIVHTVVLLRIRLK